MQRGSPCLSGTARGSPTSRCSLFRTATRLCATSACRASCRARPSRWSFAPAPIAAHASVGASWTPAHTSGRAAGRRSLSASLPASTRGRISRAGGCAFLASSTGGQRGRRTTARGPRSRKSWTWASRASPWSASTAPPSSPPPPPPRSASWRPPAPRAGAPRSRPCLRALCRLPQQKKAKDNTTTAKTIDTGSNGSSSNQSHTPPNAQAGSPREEGLAGMSNLTYAAATGNGDEVRELLRSGHDAMSVDKTGQSCLHAAATAGQQGVVRLLAEHGGMGLLMLKDKAGKTCLHRACDAGHLSVCRVLCDKGGRGLLLAQAKIGQTCLHNAAANGHYEVVQLLIERGGRELLLMRDEIGSTCLHWSVEGNQLDTSSLCGEEGGLELMVIQDVVGKTCLHRAVDEGCKEVAEMLAELGGKELLLVRDRDNLTCVQWAVELGSVDVAQVLVEKGLSMMKGLRTEQDVREREEIYRRREADLARREVEVARQEQLLKAMKGVSNGGQCKECGCVRAMNANSGGSSDTGESSCGKPRPSQNSPEKDESA
mmetsp:Transcript_38362/g.93338  ORF Transcript_38362/g.93338 Transcript_38362/m.93338 type:complete len:544 (+) Transcript_38362:579-2210(+)